MGEPEFVAIHTTYDANKAEIIRIALENEGITCQIENEHQASLTGVLAIKLLVPSDDAPQAKAFIAEHERLQSERDKAQDADEAEEEEY